MIITYLILLKFLLYFSDFYLLEGNTETEWQYLKSWKVWDFIETYFIQVIVH